MRILTNHSTRCTCK